MKIKLDENIGRRGLDLLRVAGHDVATVRDQGLQGASDETLFDVCRREGRALVTLDYDFSHVLRFPPNESSGVIVLQLGPRMSQQALLDRLRDFLTLLETHSVLGALWIVEPGRVRMHLGGDEE